MRTNPGFVVMTLLFLAMPSLANAWNLKVTVAGGGDAHYITVAYGTTTPKVMKQGTFYLYPQGAATLATVTSANPPVPPASMILDGGAASIAAGVLYSGATPITTGNHTLVVTYSGANPVTTASVSLVNNSIGGMLYSKNLNNTWSTTGQSGVADGYPVPVIIAANANMAIYSYAINGVETVINHSVAGEAYAIPGGVSAVSPPAVAAVSAVFRLFGNISASLSAPTSAYAGQTDLAPATVTASSNAAIASYSLIIDGGTASARVINQNAPNNVFTIPALSVGTHTLAATATTVAAGNSPAVTSSNPNIVNFVVAAATAVNNGCTSCHSTSFAAIVNGFEASIHAANAESTCVACHTKDTPHSAGINALTINSRTFVPFQDMTTLIVSGFISKSSNICTKCHKGNSNSLRNYSTSHAVANSAKRNADCSTCHVTVHNPNPLLGGALQFSARSFGSIADSSLTTQTTYTGPEGITTDGTDLYVAYFSSNTICKVNPLDGTVTPIAGISSSGAADGAGSEARFNGPAGITTDGINLYVCDTNNNKIRKVSIATGTVTTIAGTGTSGAIDGPGNGAAFSSPYGITTDGVNLYVADFNNNKIRKVVIATGEVSTIQTGTALNGPSGITTDGTNLYLTDQTNATARVVIATGVVTPIATTASFSTPVGITTDGTNLYLADRGNNRIMKMGLDESAPVPIAGTGATGTTTSPFFITSDGANLYVTDFADNVIRKLASQ
jgi:hypothetical protein